MLVTDDFVFVHIPKTAGTFVQQVIRRQLPVVADWDYAHTPYGELPDEWRQLPGFCVIRNPWDWYVSWFHYEIENAPSRKPRRWDAGKRAVWEGAMRSGKATFKEAVVRACTGDFEHPLTALIKEQGIDLYSACVRTIAGTALDRSDFTVLRFERLREQLLGFLGDHSEAPPELAAAIRHAPPLRTSLHDAYTEYYDDELAELIGERARWLCERFGYQMRRGGDSGVSVPSS